MRLSSHRPLTLCALLATAALAAAQTPPESNGTEDRSSAERIQPQAKDGARRQTNRPRADAGGMLFDGSGNVERWRLRVEDRRAMERAPGWGGSAPR
jgi:hypothetical protein